MADTHLTLLTLTLVCLTTALGEECPTSWPGGAPLGVPEYFYPFYPGVDMMVPEGDDTNFPRLNLNTGFPFYGQFFTYLYVSINGILYFTEPPTRFPTGGMPLENIPLISPLFVDTDPSTSEGRAYYQATTDAVILCRFSGYVRAKRLDAPNYNATWAFIATWHNLTFWRGNSSDQLNTFQVVIATDGNSSFALFNYGELNLSIAAGFIHPQAGFNSGMGENYYVIPESGTSTTADLHTLTGNTRDVGRWLTRIDKDKIKGHGSEGLVASLIVEENTSITLPCPSAGLDYTGRFWHRSYFDDSHRKLLFSQTISNTNITSHFGDRMDMSVNNTIFELTIGEARLEDDSYFSCEVWYGRPLRKTFDNVQLQVYIQPEIIMTGLNNKMTVNITCTIPRLYPAIEPGAFQLLWGALDDQNSVLETYETSKNLDNSYKYTITSTKTLTTEDDGKEVTCSVASARGTPVFITKTLTVDAETKPAPSSAKFRVDVASIVFCFFFLLIIVGIFGMKREEVLVYFCNKDYTRSSSQKASRAATDNPTCNLPLQYDDDPGQTAGGSTKC